MTPKHLRIGIGVLVCIVAIVVYFTSQRVSAKNTQQPFAGENSQNAVPTNSTSGNGVSPMNGGSAVMPGYQAVPNAGYSTNSPGSTSGTTVPADGIVYEQPTNPNNSKPVYKIPPQNTPPPQGTP